MFNVPSVHFNTKFDTFSHRRSNTFKDSRFFEFVNNSFQFSVRPMYQLWCIQCFWNVLKYKSNEFNPVR